MLPPKLPVFPIGDRRLALAVCALLALGFAPAAGAAPISMDPGSVQVSTTGNPFTLIFDGGDTSDNILNFTAQGGGGDGFLPSTALVAIVFDGTDIIDAGDQYSGLFDPNNVVRGVAFDGTGVAAALLLDSSAPSAESFFLQLSSTPTTATLYSLDSISFSDITSLQDVLSNYVTAQDLRFSTAFTSAVPVPEPTSALVFAVGLIATHRAIRRRRRA